MVLIRCQLVVVDGSFPVRVEARFHDADGVLVIINDKEPMFTDATEAPGQGWVRGTERGRDGEGPTARVHVSLTAPDGLVTSRGHEVVEVLARELRADPDGESERATPLVVHPMIGEIFAGKPPHEALPTLVEAWGAERTSELATAIEIIDELTREPGAALAALVDRVQAAGWDESWTYDDAAMAARAVVWAEFTSGLAALREAGDDPRIGRAVEDMLAVIGGSDSWFHPGQVAHIAGPFPGVHAEPSFADHALALLARHADGGTAARLEELATWMLVEAACNEAAMAAELRDLAAELRSRHPHDRGLSDEHASALRARASLAPRPPGSGSTR